MVLVTNAIAILSEDRFLARIGWSASSATEPAFGAGPGDASVKSKIVNLIASVRTLMRSMCPPPYHLVYMAQSQWASAPGRVRREGELVAGWEEEMDTVMNDRLTTTQSP